MFGKVTKGVNGDIDDVDADIIVKYPGDLVAVFKHQVRIRPRNQRSFGLRGDSGTLLINIKTRKACALYFAKDSSGSGYATPIARVLKELGVVLA
jgi:hypothetical protein